MLASTLLGFKSSITFLSLSEALKHKYKYSQLVSFSLARVRDSRSLFQSDVCNLFLRGIKLLSVLSGCPQGES